jgi:transcriptional regulator with XRE-family HTH domain
MSMTLREARRRKGMTQDVLADKSGVDQTHISSIEIGRRVPSKDVRERLAEALGMAPSKLQFPEPEPAAIGTRDSDSLGHKQASR